MCCWIRTCNGGKLILFLSMYLLSFHYNTCIIECYSLHLRFKSNFISKDLQRQLILHLKIITRNCLENCLSLFDRALKCILNIFMSFDEIVSIHSFNLDRFTICATEQISVCGWPGWSLSSAFFFYKNCLY